MNDIEAFSSAYQSRLDEAELGKRIPENISLEVIQLMALKMLPRLGTKLFPKCFCDV